MVGADGERPLLCAFHLQRRMPRALAYANRATALLSRPSWLHPIRRAPADLQTQTAAGGIRLPTLESRSRSDKDAQLPHATREVAYSLDVRRQPAHDNVVTRHRAVVGGRRSWHRYLDH